MNYDPSRNTPNESVEVGGVLNTRIISPTQFQHEQTNLVHSIVLDSARVGCRYDEVLAEILSRVRMGVVLDRNTSKSRTSWLSGMIETEPILMVVDAVSINGITRSSIDVWCNIQELPELFLREIQETAMGSVSKEYQELGVNWYLVNDQDVQNQLVIELTSHEDNSKLVDEEIIFYLDYQGILTERFKASFPVDTERVSVAIDLTNTHADWNGNLDEPYLVLYISDAEWKSIERYHKINYSWRDALVHQTKRHLSNGFRYTGFNELSHQLNIETDGNSSVARRLFFDFCRSLDVGGCTGERISDHCSRAVILTGLVICFNPPRGLTGYLDMVLGDMNYEPIAGLGSDRTWRDHLSGIVNLANDFKPTPVKLAGSRKHRKPGRPPMQLIPTTAPVDLFSALIEKPETIVCKLCRFSDY